MVWSGRVLKKIPGSKSGSGRVRVLKCMIGYFQVSFLLTGIFGYSWVYLIISGYNWVYRISSLLGGSETNIKVFFNIYNGYFCCQPPTTTQYCRGVIPKISSLVWEYPKNRVIPKTSGLPIISGKTWIFGLPATQWFSNCNLCFLWMSDKGFPHPARSWG